MDLIYTDQYGVEQGVLNPTKFDLSYGNEENDFELTLGETEPLLELGCYIYIDGTEYGGIVDGIKAKSDSASVTYMGRTWHGVLNSKVIEPGNGVAGSSIAILADLIYELGLSPLFLADGAKPYDIAAYHFPPYCKAYDGIRGMLQANGAKLTMEFREKVCYIGAEPIVDYSNDGIDNDTASLSVEKYKNKVNHLICISEDGASVLHLYANQSGEIVDKQYYTDMDEVTEIYEVSGSADLREAGTEKLQEYLDADKYEIRIPATDKAFDIGDIASATEIRTNETVVAPIAQKIVTIKNGAVRTEYMTGGD